MSKHNKQQRSAPTPPTSSAIPPADTAVATTDPAVPVTITDPSEEDDLDAEDFDNEDDSGVEDDEDFAAVNAAKEALGRVDVGDVEILAEAAAAARRIAERADAVRERLKAKLAELHPAVKILESFEVMAPGVGQFKTFPGTEYAKKDSKAVFDAVVAAGRIGRTIELIAAR